MSSKKLKTKLQLSVTQDHSYKTSCPQSYEREYASMLLSELDTNLIIWAQTQNNIFKIYFKLTVKTSFFLNTDSL